MTIYNEIMQLNAQFSWLIDHKDGVGVPELFVEDGWYGNSQRKLRGRAELKAFYDARKARGHRVSRHIFSPPFVHEVGEDRVESTTMLTLFAADGEGPHAPEVHLVVEYHDTVVKKDGRWFYESRETDILFGTPDL